MPDMPGGIHVNSSWGVIIFLITWLILFKAAHLLITLLRRDPLIGWAIGPLGVTVVFLHEPSTLFLWLDVLVPALVSACTLYVGLFTSLSPISLPQNLLFEIVVIVAGVLISSLGDLMRVLRDLRHPLWGEARILRCIQLLHARWARIHFTPFGHSYLNDHFRSSPTDLLQAL
ncbi:MAG: hypothetical protein IMW89_02040 [Ktedonobacteraceae bacterium]|nr:hypothetical protein [Ktedonobacteraceae bacterium]